MTEESNPIKLVDVWNKGGNQYRWEKTIKGINSILDDAANGLIDAYTAIGFIDNCLVHYDVSTHKTLLRFAGLELLSSPRDLSAARDCQSCRVIIPDGIKINRQELLCYNGERWFKIPISKPPPVPVEEHTN